MAKTYNLTEAREVLGFSYNFIKKLMIEKKISYHQAGRRIWFTEEDLQEFQKNTRVS